MPALLTELWCGRSSPRRQAPQICAGRRARVSWVPLGALRLPLPSSPATQAPAPALPVQGLLRSPPGRDGLERRGT